ncbi:MAG: PASTA domain-containing protein [Bacteroidales bacterium]|nr:PASTA domain-containing protein [Bacteroidales bacterium]
MNIKKIYKEKPIVSTLIIMLLIVIFAVLIFQFLLRFITLHNEEYDVPELLNFDQEQLKQFQENENEHDFVLTVIDSVFLPDQKGGIVISQDPMAGSKVKKGRKIYLIVSTFSQPEIEMPNLIDLSLRQAENMLITNNLEVGQIIYKASEFNNAVLEQLYKGRNIKPGAMLPYHAKITLIVGKTEATTEGESLESAYDN